MKIKFKKIIIFLKIDFKKQNNKNQEMLIKIIKVIGACSLLMITTCVIINEINIKTKRKEHDKLMERRKELRRIENGHI